MPVGSGPGSAGNKPPTKLKKGDPDASMNEERAAASKRAAESDSDGLSAPSAPAAAPMTREMLTEFMDKLAAQQHRDMKQMEGKLDSMQELTNNHFTSMSNSFAKTVNTLTDKVEAHDEANKVKFETIHAQIEKINDRLKGPLPYAAAAPLPGGLAPSSSTSTSRPTPTGPAEDCLVFIRGFPTTQPGFILKDYAAEALAVLPDEEKKLIKLRISPADTQFSMVFPSPGMATSFVENYRAMNMVFIDASKNETPLTCRTGKPIALRRRGGLIRPIYSELETILRTMPSLSTATISQTSKTRAGKMTTEFYALVGRHLTPLFTLIFKETPEEMTIEQVNPPHGDSPLSTADFDKIVQAAIPK
jgi:hypothetical protein